MGGALACEGEGARKGAPRTSLRLTEQAWQSTPASFLQSFEQALRCAELLDQAVHVLDIAA